MELLKLWKGLYYCFWHSDRVHVQQALASNLANMVLIVSEVNYISFLEAFWTTICREWKSIDVLRLDKFYTLLRRFVESSFQRLYSSDWKASLVSQYIELLEKLPLSSKDQKVPNGIRYHLADIYLESLSKIILSESERQQVPIGTLIAPFERLVLESPTKSVRLRVMHNIFDNKVLYEYDYERDPDAIAFGEPDNDLSVDESQESQSDSASEAEFTGFD